MSRKPKIAILCWEAGSNPEGLAQLEGLKGNSTNLESYPFPVKIVRVPGACVETIITNPSEKVLQDMIDLCKKMRDEEGIKAVSTSCGFNAIFQKRMAEETGMPVFTSSILQVPFVQNVIGLDKTVAIITANKSSLSEAHLRNCAITEDMNVEVYGLEDCKEFGKIFSQPDQRFEIEAVEAEIVGMAVDALAGNPNIGAFVLECTDLPPFARKIEESTGLPVFDYISLIGHVAMSIGELRLY